MFYCEKFMKFILMSSLKMPCICNVRTSHKKVLLTACVGVVVCLCVCVFLAIFYGRNVFEIVKMYVIEMFCI